MSPGIIPAVIACVTIMEPGTDVLPLLYVALQNAGAKFVDEQASTKKD